MGDGPKGPLGRARDARARGDLDTLLAMLSSSEAEERLDAVLQIKDIADERATETLVRTLDDDYFFVRMYAVGVLEKIGDASAADAIAEVGLNDGSRLVRLASANALAAFGDRRAVTLYEALLLNPGRGWRRIQTRFIARKLVELRGVEALPALEAAAARAGLAQRLRLRRTIADLKRPSA